MGSCLVMNVHLRSRLFGSTWADFHIYLLIANLASSLSKQEDWSNWGTNKIIFYGSIWSRLTTTGWGDPNAFHI